MSSLSKQLRNELARVVLAARILAEDAAAKALHTLGIDEADAPGHLDNDGRTLRRSLRAQARQLGDGEDPKRKGCYQVRHLSERIAYDHWHRLLFARFLAENDLLISPDHGVGVSMSDCDDLAPELGMRDGWEVAARFAARMLPQIFRADDPSGAVLFAPEDRASLRKLVIELPREIFLADDALGWVYQFWQAQRKEEVNDSEDKIGADELAPVTQLFTEDYMVLFLLHNTLGAWWAGKKLSVISEQLSVVKTEEDCRKLIALPGVDWEYLRFIKDEKTGAWRPAAGTFDGWPKIAKELRLLDPCMGSGHFLVFELPILVAMRMDEEGLSKKEAVVAVLRDNLFGLELDPRCTQIAAFNLALAAWKLVGGHCHLPSMNLACSGLGINARREDWVKLAGDDTRLQEGMDQLFELFQKAPELGSLINPRQALGEGDLLSAGFHDIAPLLEKALVDGKADERVHEMAVVAHGLAKSAEILAGQFTLVATNVPYLGMPKQHEELREFCKTYHPEAKGDLASCFQERSLALCSVGGSTALVSLQNWLYLVTYKKLRFSVLSNFTLNFIASLGPRGFQTPMYDFNVMLGIVTRQKPYKLEVFGAADLSGMGSPEEKAESLATMTPRFLKQSDQFTNPDSRISLESATGSILLSSLASSHLGICTGDYPRFGRGFWELENLMKDWSPEHSSVPSTCCIGGMSDVLYWQDGHGDFYNFLCDRLGENGISSWLRGGDACGKKGIIVTAMGDLPASLYYGNLFDNNVTVIIPDKPEYLAAVWSFCEAAEFRSSVRRINQSLKITDQSMVEIPFDLAHWQKVAAEKYPHGLPKPHSNDPTQWLFNGHPAGADQPLQVAVARLLGYQWPRQTGSSFPDCPALSPDGLEKFADSDGIVCISAIKGEQPAAERIRALLSAAFGKEWSAVRQAELLAAVGFDGKTLEDWLRTGFFEQHCQMFHHRPFIWHIWDGLRDGFSVLVNYHKLNRATLEKLTYTYLGDWIARQKAAVSAGEEGSDAKLAAAQTLKLSLEKILEGEAPYDIFVRWKPLDKQPVGWEPDLNDGVRMNIRPFLSVPDIGKKGAGILRWKPNINWNKDRGTDVASAPWFKVFKGERINDHHLTLEEKRNARKTGV